MPMKTNWIEGVRSAAADVEAWIAKTAPGDWLAPRPGGWTDKDLLGHLAAWSDLLMDQVEALRQDRPETIESIDVDAWNAEQVANRREWTVEEAIAAWRRAVQRALDVIHNLPSDIWDRRWCVAWAPEMVSVGDVLRLWLVHVEQHRPRLGRRSADPGPAATERG